MGAGGVGKTTLSLALARRLDETARHGAWFVDLAPYSDPILVPNAFAASLAVTNQSANVLAALRDDLRHRDAILVVDNCEHVIGAAAEVIDTLLHTSESLRIITTSREPLDVKGERVRRLAGLEAPPNSASLPAVEAMRFPAVQLFVEIARKRHRSFELSDADAPMVADICRRLDGLALAIELAAMHVDASGLGGLFNKLGDSFQKDAASLVGPERHRTVAAAIDWSYGLLTKDEKAIFRRLSVFPGRFSLHSACAVVSTETVQPNQVLEIVASLVAKSLIAVEGLGGSAEYYLLETTRAYGLDKLVATGESDMLNRKHAEHLLAREAGDETGISAGSDIGAPQHGTLVDFRAAIRWALAGTETARLAVRLTVAAIPLWEKLSLIEECRAALSRILGEEFASSRTVRDDLVLNLTQGASTLHTHGPLPSVETALEKALNAACQENDLDLELECLRGLFEFHLWRGDARSVMLLADRLQSTESRRRNSPYRHSVSGQVASAKRYLGDLEEARRGLERLVSRQQGPRHRHSKARFAFDQRLTALGSLATVLWLQGFSDKAIAFAQAQREEALASNHAVAVCNAIIQTSVVISLFVGDLRQASQHLDYIERYSADHQLRFWSAMARCQRGIWQLEAGEEFEVEEYRIALAELYEGGFRMRYPLYLAHYAHGLAMHGLYDGALASIEEAIDLSIGSGHVWGVPEMLRMKGGFLLKRSKAGAFYAADACFRQALEMSESHGSLAWELRASCSLVELWRQDGGDRDAEERLAGICRRFKEGFWTADFRRAYSIMRPAPAG